MIMMAVSGAAWWGRLLALIVEGATFLFILWTSAVRPRVLALAAVLVAGAIIAAAIPVVRGSPFSAGPLNGLGALLALVAPVVIARHLLEELRITGSTVLGALCLYLLAGLFFAYVFGAIGESNQGHFFAQTTHPSSTDYLYFSLVTLTTLGYGDLTANGDLGKMLAATEALAGQLYLVSVVAVLVANIGQAPRRRRSAEQGDAPEEDRTA
jgi:hypothetical protein